MIKDCVDGVVCSSNPARAPVSRTTIRARRPSEILARRGASGGARRSQMTKIAASATAPAPKKRGRERSKPTMEGLPSEVDDTERDEGDPGPDLELAAMHGMSRSRAAQRRQRETLGRFEL